MESRDNETVAKRSRLTAAQAAVLEQRLRRGLLGRADLPTAIPRRSGDGSAPLSPAQRSLWFLDRLVPDSALYNISQGFRLRGTLDVAALERSLNAVVRRHESLRTSFRAEGEEPVQIVAPEGDLALTTSDLQTAPEAHREAAAQQWMNEAARQPFNLETGPLLRAALLTLGPADHLLVLTVHHIIFDGWSQEVLLRELSAFYRNLVAEEALELPPLPVQCADYARWQQDWVRSAACAQQLEFWKKELAGLPEALPLPTDRPHLPQPSFRGELRTLHLPAVQTAALRALAVRENATMFMILLAAFKVLLLRYSQQTDLVVGTPVANRQRVELENLIGFLVNMLVLRTDAGGNPTFRELLNRVKEVVARALEHQDLPFERLVQELRPTRRTTSNPLFQVGFSYQPVSDAGLDLPGVSVTTLPIFTGTSKFDLFLFVEEHRGELWLTMEFSTDLFEAATIERMLGHLQRIMACVSANPDQRIGELPLLSEADQQRMLIEWNQTRTECPRAVQLQRLFERQAQRVPQRVAVAFEGRTLTYAELNARASALASHLRGLGVGPDVLVGLCVERSLELVVGVLGILKAGGACVPLDPAVPRGRLATMLEDAQAPVLVTQRALLGALPEIRPRLVLLDEPLSAVESPAAGGRAPSDEDLAYVIYTSGSTGQPKGVMVKHRSAVNLITAIARDEPGFGEEDVMLAVTTLSFDIAVAELFLPLTTGGRLELVSRETASDGPALLAALQSSGATFLQPTPVTWRLLLEAGWTGNPGLKMVSTGEALPRELAGRLLPKGAGLWNLYGPTETTIWSTGGRVTRSDQPISIGRPLANTQVYIVTDGLQPAPIGVPGELLIGGDGLARGYLNEPELTAEKFVANPFQVEPGARLYRTGDLARWLPDGTIECLGRMDHQVKLRGCRLELGEIETLLEKSGMVAEAVVVLCEPRAEEPRLVAYVTPAAGAAAPGTAALRERLLTHLPDYMVPAQFVVLDRLPRTANGKIDRKALPSPPAAGQARQSPVVAPRTPIEEVIAATWAEILGVETVGVQDNFFELGGHSLQVIQIIDRLNKAGLGLAVDQILQHQTVEELARVAETRRVVKAGAKDWSSLVTLQPRGSKPPFYLVHTAPGDVLGYMKLVYYLGNDQPCYGFQALGLSQPEACHTRLQDMAAHYVKELRQFQPCGPYYLGGWCFGGNVALEMARQLVDQQQEVKLLALMETWPHPPPLGSRLRWRHWLEIHRRLGVAGTARHYLRRLAGLLREPDPAAAQDDVLNFHATESGPLKHREQVYSTNWRATRDYRAPRKVYPGRVTLFFRKDYGPEAITPDLDFAALAREVETHLVPGDHRYVLKDPHVQTLAAKLKVTLDVAQLEASIAGADAATPIPNSIKTG